MSRDGAMVLPRWARQAEDGVIEIDPDVAYPVYLALLSIDLDELSQFWLEVARRCLTADLKTLLGTPLYLRFRPSEHWVLARLPAGGGAALGAGSFRAFYGRIEGRGLVG